MYSVGKDGEWKEHVREKETDRTDAQEQTQGHIRIGSDKQTKTFWQSETQNTDRQTQKDLNTTSELI